MTRRRLPAVSYSHKCTLPVHTPFHVGCHRFSAPGGRKLQCDFISCVSVTGRPAVGRGTTGPPWRLLCRCHRSGRDLTSSLQQLQGRVPRSRPVSVHLTSPIATLRRHRCSAQYHDDEGERAPQRSGVPSFSPTTAALSAKALSLAAQRPPHQSHNTRGSIGSRAAYRSHATQHHVTRLSSYTASKSDAAPYRTAPANATPHRRPDSACRTATPVPIHTLISNSID